jgi:hypothetical protein
MLYYNGVIYHQNSTNYWYKWVVQTSQTDPANWVALGLGADPRNPAPAPTPTPTTAYTAQRIIDCMVLPNSPSGWYPAWGPINYNPGQDPNQQNNQWGSDQAGDPNTHSYAYVSTAIRAGDPSTAEDGFALLNLENTGYSDNQNIMPYPWVDVCTSWQLHTTYNGVVTSNTATNARVHYRNFTHYVLLTTGQWVLAGYASMSSGIPGSYLNFGPSQGPNRDNTLIYQGAGYDQFRYEPDGGVSLGAICQTYPANYSVWENYPLGGYVRTKGYFKSNVVGSVVWVEARTILHNPAGIDDRNLQNAMIKMGCDWTIQSVANLGEYFHSNWQVIPADGQWRLYAASDIAKSVLRNNPPPGISA